MKQFNLSDIQRISRELDAFYTALRAHVYFTEFQKQRDVRRNNAAFWDFAEFTILYSLLINWNEIFGIEARNNHWKEVTLEDPDFVKRLYEAGQFSYASWTEYRSYVNELKHDFVLFPDPYHHRGREYDLAGIGASLEVTQGWLIGLVTGNDDLVDADELCKWPMADENHIASLENEVRKVLDAVAIKAGR